MNRNGRGIAYLFTVAALTGTSLPAFAPPVPPDDVCFLDAGNCGGASSSPGSGMKWNPGDYLKTQGNHADSDQRGYFDEIASNIKQYANESSSIKGAFVAYSWHSLEPADDNFDWRPVYDHIAALNGKKLIVELGTKSFSSIAGYLAPSWLENSTEFHAAEQSGENLAIWRTSVKNEFIEFIEAFAAEFDDNPALEMFAINNETCLTWGGSVPGDYSAPALVSAYGDILDAAVTAFTQTHVVAKLNCNVSGEFDEMMEHAYRIGAGRGDPDAHNTPGAVLFRGGSSSTRDYRGLIPHMTIVSGPNLGNKDDLLPLSNVLNQLDSQDVTHAPWIPGNQNVTWNAIVSAIESRAYPDTACPVQTIAKLGGCQ